MLLVSSLSSHSLPAQPGHYLELEDGERPLALLLWSPGPETVRIRQSLTSIGPSFFQSAIEKREVSAPGKSRTFLGPFSALVAFPSLLRTSSLISRACLGFFSHVPKREKCLGGKRPDKMYSSVSSWFLSMDSNSTGALYSCLRIPHTGRLCASVAERHQLMQTWEGCHHRGHGPGQRTELWGIYLSFTVIMC